MIMATDYDNYAIVYNCNPSWFGMAMTENLWILGREQRMEADNLKELQDWIKENVNGYDSDTMGVVDKQRDWCDYKVQAE